ncbi:Nitroreductase family protein [Enhygromyxa salina]|uniref:Nitroreductase family protein n=2 Tax=Enhygromyxa salina TaxID=215803 RepID=A0A2S9XPM3_9BACT|nr:Nitroreductase family protein [Enhygromyxa salina]
MSEMELDPTEPLRISRFTTVTWEVGELVVRNLRTGKALVCDDAALVQVLHWFRVPTSPAQVEASGGARELGVDVIAACRTLKAAGILVRPEQESRPPDVDGALDPSSYWAAPELALQRHSRECRPQTLARYRFEGLTRSEPHAKPPMSATAIALPEPEPAAVDFWQVLVRRRSFSPPTATISLDQLGEFFHWTARSWDARELDDGRVLQHRLYPSAGGLYAHEIYPVVSPAAVEGLAPDVYHYCPQRHALEPLRAEASLIAELVERGASVSAAKGGAKLPLIVLLVTSRIARVAYKYDHIAYVSQLKDVGCLYAYFYLVATALGLAPCAYGGGFETELLAGLTGVDPLSEPIVGEFGLGGLDPAATPEPPWPILSAPRSGDG